MKPKFTCLAFSALGLALLPLAAQADTPDASTTLADTATIASTSSPTITTQPISLVVDAGANAAFAVVATGTGTLRYQWFRNGWPVEGATSATLTLTSVTAANAGVYTVLVRDDSGRKLSSAATLAVNVVAGTITTAPQSLTVNAGGNATFTVVATGTGLTYQWRHNGRTLAGATAATLSLTNVGITEAGSYAVSISNASGVAAVAAANLAVTEDARLSNISTRGHVGTGDDQLIVGFVIRGQGTKSVLMRAVGPTLATQFGVTDALATPKLTFVGRSHGKVVADSNTSWGGSATLAQAFTQVGAFALPAGSADAALLESVDTGAFTANVTGVGDSTGIALAELYDADTGTPSTEFVNISARARVGAEAANTLIAGFAITGTTSDTVLIRGVGPTLGSRFGMREALRASRVTLFDSKGNQIAVNAGWGAAAHDDQAEDTEKEDELDEVSDHVGAFRLDHGSHDAALVVTLAPGVYTAHVTGVNNSTGIALVEIYEIR